jgi:glycosyltransferase involved in cell wall biosynthesis
MLRIALTADPELPVPPRLYGGIERIVDMLARGLVQRGHHVTLLSHPESTCPVTRVAWPGASSGSRGDTIRNALTLAREVAFGGYDLVHSFSRLSYLTPILPLPIPKLMCYQRPISPRTTSLAWRLSRGTLDFCAISRWMTHEVEQIGRWHMVPNGVPLEIYDYVPDVASDAPLVFLGRLEEIKGPHLAIEIARRSGRRLVIAGNIPAEHQGWYDAHVAPHLDGEHVRYVGPVDDAQKNALLGQAAAFLMPILWDEPFGIVMAEAMACGTPVIGTPRGAVPEVVEDGVTGLLGKTVEEMSAAVAAVSRLSRRACRDRVEALYSEAAVVEGYLAVYHQMLARK